MTMGKMTKLRTTIIFILFITISCNQQTTSTTPQLLHPELPPEVKPPLPPGKIAKIDSLLTDVMKRYRYNGTALVAIQGFPVFKYSNGYANLYQKTPLDLNTAFQIASLSKSFTAMCVLILYDRGQLDIHDPVIEYIPEFPFDNITIRQMLQHTSGLQNYMYFVDHYWDDEVPITNEDVLDLINDHEPQLNFVPGRRHLYNNTGYAMLALLVERVSGKRYYNFLQDEIFIPLGMSHSFAWNRATVDTTTNIATGFTKRGWKYRKFSHDPLDEVLGDKSVFTTVEDLLKWDQSLYSDLLISDTLLAEAFTKGETSRGRTFKYGYGWRLNELDGKNVVYHNGLWNGFTSSLKRYVDDELTIILLNNTNAPVASIEKQVYQTVKKELEKKD